MNQIHLERWAALLCDYCFEIQPGQSLAIQTSTAALPLVRGLHNALLEREAFPWLRLSYPEQRSDFHAHAHGLQLERAGPADVAALERVDAFLRIEADAQTLLRDVPPAKLMRERRTSAQLSSARAGKSWCVTLFPTAGYAEQAGMSLPDFEAFVVNAMFLDREQPVSGWLEIRARQTSLVERLERAKIVQLETARTRLTLDVGGRVWRNSDGKRNMPSGEVFSSPWESSAQGTVFFDVPTNVSGHRVSGVRLDFRDGVVVNASAEQGEPYLLQALETDEGARRLGEIGIGTNAGIQRGTGNILFDEKIGGTVHLAVGSSYAECGGLNRSALHWDLIMDMRVGGRVLLDGEVFQENGRFV
jgi:aminopeptidase